MKHFGLTLLVLATFGLEARAATYDSWKSNYFQLDDPNSAPGVDADNDGYTNWIEFTFATNPTSSLSRPVIAPSEAGPSVAFSYSVYTLAESVSTIPLMSDDLGIWRTGPSQFVLDTPEGAAPNIALTNFVATDASTSGSATRFFRLGVFNSRIDTDGDGIPDGYETLFGMNPNLDNSVIDSDGDGLTDSEEYLLGTDPKLADNPFANDPGGNGGYDDEFGTGGDPGNPSSGPLPQIILFQDTDGDGLADGNDDYPFSYERQVAPGLRHFGLLDLTKYPGSMSFGNFGGENAIAVDDRHRVAWWTTETLNTGFPVAVERIRLFTWDNKKITGKKLLEAHANNSSGVAKYYIPRDINATGTLVGGWCENFFSSSKTVGFVATTTSVRLVHPLGNETDSSLYSIMTAVQPSPKPLVFGIGNKGPLPDSGGYVGVPYHRNAWKPAWETGYEYAGVASNGDAIGRLNADGYPWTIWDNSNDPFAIFGATQVFDVNKWKQVVGIHDNSDNRGAIWTNVTGDPMTYQWDWVENWIPYEVRNSFSGSVPFLINDSHDVLFAGYLLEGGDQGQWKVRCGWVNERMRNGAEGHEIGVGIFGDTIVESYVPYRQNQSGTLAGQLWHPASNIYVPALAIPCEFVSNDIAMGFDYPIMDDPALAPYGHGLSTPPDQDRPQWWTSVAQSDPTGAGFDTSEHVSLDFASNDAAQMFRLRIAPLSPHGLITLTPASPLTSRRTLLTIQGHTSATGEAEVAKIEVVADIPSDPNVTPQVIRTLNVAVLPLRYLPVRIYWVYDTVQGGGVGDAFPNFTRVRQEARIPDQIIGRLNDTFRQCGVQFYLHHTSGPLPVHYDLDGSDSLSDDAFNKPEVGTFLELTQLDPHCPTIFVLRNYPGNAAGFKPIPPELPEDPNNYWCFVFEGKHWNMNQFLTEFYLHTCAHEIGHVLGLSTHDFIGNTFPVHDRGPIARRYGAARPLMRTGSSVPLEPGIRRQDYWIRQEDWFNASDIAGAILALQPL